MGWSIRLEWHTRVTREALLAHRSAFSTPKTLEPPTAGIIFWTSLDSLSPSMCTRLGSRAVLALELVLTMQCGAQNVVYGIWNLEHNMENGMWNVEHGIFNMEHCVRNVEPGERGVCSMEKRVQIKEY